jgi:hypothetical protein
MKLFRLKDRNYTNQKFSGRALPLVALVLASFAIAPMAYAVVPAPDGGYPGGNTAEGQNALLSLSTGTYNTAVGLFSLLSNTEGKFNTAIGAGTLLANTEDQNTATGAGALLSNTEGAFNTANGAFALFSNTTGFRNTANGIQALFDNTSGSFNTAIGNGALHHNTEGSFNTAIDALPANTTGDDNVALGFAAGLNVTTADHVICIGAGVQGANVSNSCYIGQIFDATIDIGTATIVGVDADGKLGTDAVDAAGNKVPLASLLGGQRQAMLNGKVEKLQATVTQQQKQIEILTAQLKEQAAQIQKVSAQLEASKPTPQIVNNP